MPIKVLIGDDDQGIRSSHKFALQAAADLLHDSYVAHEVDNSVDAWAKIHSERFDLILLDNDFKDGNLKGHLPGVALLQLARKEGANTATPIIFCSAETFETLKPMVERFNCVHFPKAGYDIDTAARIMAEQIGKGRG
jgi:CheY-like chemotaxis protein